MNIKWNWGTGILIAIITFMGFMAFMVYQSTRQNFDLVERDYYPKALEYQQKIDKIANARALDEKVKLQESGGVVEVVFQSVFSPDDVRGTIVFYRPSNKKMDLSFPISLDTARTQYCSTTDLANGKYIVKVDYEVDGTKYYQEETILLKMF
jgi:hypothetical protein